MWILLTTLLLVTAASVAERLPDPVARQRPTFVEENPAPPLPQKKLNLENQRVVRLTTRDEPEKKEDLEEIVESVRNTSESEEEEKEEPEFAIPDITPETLAEVLKSEKLTKRMIDCVLYYEEGVCPPAFRRVNRVAPQIFRNAGRCPTCSRETNQKLRHLLSMLQRRQPSQYRRMIAEFQSL